MTLQEFYSTIDGSYENAMENLLKEERILKYLLRFPDSEDYTKFAESFSAENYPEAFRYIHNLKGISLTLGFSRLAELSSFICEALRYGPPETTLSAERQTLTAEYERVLRAIQLLFQK